MNNGDFKNKEEQGEIRKGMYYLNIGKYKKPVEILEKMLEENHLTSRELEIIKHLKEVNESYIEKIKL